MTDISRDSLCYLKAKQRGERTFTLVEQDKSAVSCIAWWILQNIDTCPAPKLRQALEDAIAMRDYPRRKIAD